ncbi:SDR family NAD(P)-dependent oxidoreductase, partial [Streptomyces sp. DSM 41528]|nr:SDR family NAD(P)-dependent oxidoreductase [Streptomyces sp. DSM 41528]
SYIPAEEAAFREGLVAQGMSEVEAALWTAALDPIRTSREAPVKDGVERALGRPPRDLAEVVREAAEKGAWG